MSKKIFNFGTTKTTGSVGPVVGGEEPPNNRQVIVDTSGQKWWFDITKATGFSKAIIKGVEITIYKTSLGNFVLHSMANGLQAGYDDKWYLYSEQEIVAWALEYELADVLVALGSAINNYEK